jgi:hypothetical protein
MKSGLRGTLTHDGRWLLALLTLSYTAIIFALPASDLISAQHLLQGLGVAALDHPFMDLRGVAAWCEAWSAGKDPSVVETWIRFPSGELHHNFLMNYSPLVLGLGNLGAASLSSASVVGWGAGLALLYGAALWVLCGPCSLRDALLWALLTCSPLSVLVIERGNLDTLIFFFLVAALILRKFPWIESLLILAASLLKFFPIVALLALWKKGAKGYRLSVILGALLFLIFLFMMRRHLVAIGGSLGGQYQSAFGCTTLADLMIHYGMLPPAEPMIARVCKLFAMIGIAGSFAVGFCFHCKADRPSVSERALHSFFLGAPLMLTLFVLGPQMDYKWIFFLLMLPMGMEIARSSSDLETLAAKIWLSFLTLYSYWTFFSDENSLRNSLLKQLLMWGIILLSAFLSGRLWNRRTVS